MTAQRYDTIGRGYTSFRRPDPRIAAQIWSAIGDAARIVNVGAGTGSYEDATRNVVAVEPSAVMVGQRGPGGAPVVRAAAEHLPFPDRSFDVAMASMTVHHWLDLRAGLAEMCRVADRQVIFTFDPSMHDALWVFTEYVPASVGFADAAPLEEVIDVVGTMPGRGRPDARRLHRWVRLGLLAPAGAVPLTVASGQHLRPRSPRPRRRGTRHGPAGPGSGQWRVAQTALRPAPERVD